MPKGQNPSDGSGRSQGGGIQQPQYSQASGELGTMPVTEVLEKMERAIANHDNLTTTVNVTVPATTANLGPGFDCIGAALTLYNRFKFSHNLTSSTSQHHRNWC